MRALLLRAAAAAGACFGEQSLISGKTSDFWVISVSYCVLYKLAIDDFKMLKSEFEKTFKGYIH